MLVDLDVIGYFSAMNVFVNVSVKYETKYRPKEFETYIFQK
jgi:hypothetical protein